MKKLFILLAFLGVVSCDDTANDTNSANVIMPLKVGNYWTFVDSSFDDAGVFIESDTSTLGITGTKTVQFEGSSYQVYLWTWISYNLDYSWLAWNGDDGLYIFGGTSPKGDFVLAKSLSIKYPADVNDQWQEYNMSYSSRDSTFRISDTSITTCSSQNAVLVSPMGDLTCYTYTYSEDFGMGKYLNSASRNNSRLSKPNALTTVTLYYAPDVGYVGLIDETGGIITYKKTVINYLADK